mgnify:CR=1 FL=1
MPGSLAPVAPPERTTEVVTTIAADCQVVAALAAGVITSNGAQAAIMAPTSILAEQHYRNFTNLLKDILKPEEIRLLVGDTSEAEKEEIRNGLANNTIKIVIGTHAVIEGPVQFAELQFAVIDEQHRFGVKQRSQLKEKAVVPHLLVMSATPIPRTLALTLYGDLDVSILDEKPKGRKPVETMAFSKKEQHKAYQQVGVFIEKGQQAYVVCPAIEESELELSNVYEVYEQLKNKRFPQVGIALILSLIHI